MVTKAVHTQCRLRPSWGPESKHLMGPHILPGINFGFKCSNYKRTQNACFARARMYAPVYVSGKLNRIDESSMMTFLLLLLVTFGLLVLSRRLSKIVDFLSVSSSTNRQGRRLEYHNRKNRSLANIMLSDNSLTVEYWKIFR